MIPWDKLHGAMTHFPIALLLFSTACDFVSFTFKKLPFARGLRLVSFYGLAVGGIYQNHSGRETEPANKPLAAEDLAAKGRSFFLRSCAQCHGRDADGGEEAPSLLNLQISGAHMTLVIQSGIKGEMPTFSKKYNAQDTAAIVAYLKTLH